MEFKGSVCNLCRSSKRESVCVESDVSLANEAMNVFVTEMRLRRCRQSKSQGVRGSSVRNVETESAGAAPGLELRCVGARCHIWQLL